MGSEKILAIKFKFLGDVALMVPALRMLRQRYPQAELHTLVAAEAAPLLTGLGWLDHVWALPRTRGKLRLRDSLPIVRQLRSEKFDRSVDFVGNDRGAVLSRMIGARERLGVIAPKGFSGRTRCYTQTIEELDTTRHESVRDAYVLSAWDVPFDREALGLELSPREDALSAARELISKPTIIGHLSTSQEKKEWPVEYWSDLADRLSDLPYELAFTAGPSEREQDLLRKLQERRPDLRTLPAFETLDHFIATLSLAKLFISPDTAPLHLAAGLGVPTIGFFGPTASSRWAPLGKHQVCHQGLACPCSGHLHQCALPNRCIDTVTPAEIARSAHQLLEDIAHG
ncbi:MAG: glycosyltransferase family 9 protein [Verrucomicrobiota bacterium]